MGGSGSSSKMARELKGKSRPLAIIRLRLFRVLVNTPICRNYCRIRQLIGSEFILMNELGFSFPKVEFSASCSDAAAGMRPDKALPPGARESCMPSERGRGTPRPPEPTSLSAAFQFRIRGRFGVLRKVSGGRALRPLTSCPSDVMMSAGRRAFCPGGRMPVSLRL